MAPGRLLGLTVLVLLIILPCSLTTEVVTRTSRSYSIVRRVRGQVSSSSSSSSYSSSSSSSSSSHSSSQDRNITAGAGYVDSYTFRNNRRQREKYKDIRNIRTTTSVLPVSPEISTAISFPTSMTPRSPPVATRRPQGSQSKYNSAEANYLALRRNNYKARQYRSSTSPAPKHKRSIKDEVGDMINQLKSDLENLLRFNENLLSFNSSIVKKAVKSKVENFFSTVSTAIDSQRTKKTSNDSVAAAVNILDVTEDIGRTMASTLELDSREEIKLANISLVVMKRRLGLEKSTRWDSAGVVVDLPDQEAISEDQKSVSVSFTSYNNLGQLMSDEHTGANIRSPVLSVNVVDKINHNLRRSIPLTKPIEFLIRHKPLKRVRKRKCTYWEFKYAAWSSDGCYTIRNKSTATVTACQCYHLTNFAIAVELLDNDIAGPTTTTTTTSSPSPRLVSWEYLQYYSAQPSVTDARQFGDKIVPTKTTASPDQFKVYRVTTTESLPRLNYREVSADGYDWEEFERRENEKLSEQQGSQLLLGDSFKLN